MVRKRRQMLLLLLVAVITTLYTCVRFYHTNFLGRMHVPDHPKICQESSNEFSDSSIPLLFQDRNSDDSKLSVCSETVDNPFKNSKGWQKFISALEHYKHFHKKQLEILKRNSSAAGSIRTLTFTCHEIYCSGLGDQFLRLQFFFLLAVMSDRVFTIEWDEGLTRKTSYLQPNQINWKFSTKSLCGKQCSRTMFGRTSVIWQGWKQKDLENFGQVLFSSSPNIVVSGRVGITTWFITDSSTLKKGLLIQKGFLRMGVSDILTDGDANSSVVLYTYNLWKHLCQTFALDYLIEIPDKHHARIAKSWYHLSHYILHYLFAFHPSLIEKVDHIQRMLGLFDNRYLAIHMRTGYVGTPFQENAIVRWMTKNTKMYVDENSWKVMLEHSVKLATEKLGPNSLIYLATDSPKPLEVALSMYGDRIKTSNMTIQPHSKYSSSGSGCGNKVDSADDRYLSFWVDFFMLGRAYIMVHGYSSFAMSAGFLCPIPLERNSWVLYSEKKDCVASHIQSNVTCLLSQA